MLDHFVVRYGLDLDVAQEAAALDDAQIARMLVDVDVPRDELVRLSRGLTPARLAAVIALLDPVELMFALKKLRARRSPANQAHVTTSRRTRRCSQPTPPKPPREASRRSRRPWASRATRR